MEKSESLEELYKRKFNNIPENLYRELGHFNVFRLEPYVGEKAKPVPYKKRDYFKIMLIIGKSRFHYADRMFEVKKQALCFSNPNIPYKYDHLEKIEGGAFCIFNYHFFNQYGNLNKYEIFQPGGTHIIELSDDQLTQVNAIYDRMFEEINSDYIYKYDVLRNLVFEILHFALKLQPSTKIFRQHINASQRISTLFLELLERQFPIDDTHQRTELRSASDFADQLNIHVNHLNRAVKEITQKTTTQIISERVLDEAKILLKQTSWSVSEIAYALGFTEVTHFNNFFRKHLNTSPLKFRNGK